MPGPPLTLEKWYLDAVSDDGVALVAYVGALTWHGLSLRFSARLLANPGQPPVEDTSLLDTEFPSCADGRLSWTSAALGLRGEWRALDAPIAQTLLDSTAGQIEWSCLMPRARVSIATPSVRFEGLGYAERVRLTLPPWALPFRTLHWGRHTSDRHALVWIAWDGAEPLRVAWLDGEPQPAARVTETGVVGLTRQRALGWQAGRDLTRRAVDTAIARVSPMLAARVSGRLSTMQEHKQLSPSSLVDAGGHAIDHGWAIHEVVTW